MSAADVLVFEGSSNGLSGWDGLSVVVDREGRALVLDSAFGSSGVQYKEAFVGAETVSGLRQCVESNSFRSLDAKYTNQDGASGSGSFCALADASTVVISSGPAAAYGKSVTAYALGYSGSCRPERPEPLVGLFQALGRIRSEVAKSGEPAPVPSPDLAPR